MNPAAAVVIFILIWWCVFFAVLPMGVRGRWEQDGEGDGVVGAEPGAPQDPGLKRKALLTTGVSFGLWIVVCVIIMSGIINFRD